MNSSEPSPEMPDQSSHESLSETFRRVLIQEGDNPGAVNVGMIMDAASEKGFGLLLLILSLPSALPIPATGYSTFFGIILLLLGLQMMIGRHSPWLPQFIRRKTVSPKMAERVVGMSKATLGRLEKLIRPRLRWLTGRAGHAFTAFLVIFMALLMCIPIPSTNTFPAAVIFLIAISLTEQDGLFAIGAVFVGVIAAFV